MTITSSIKKIKGKYVAMEYPDWACESCGKEHGRGIPKNHVSTWHYGKCEICGQNKSVTQARDFGHFPNWFNRDSGAAKKTGNSKPRKK